jgi:alcohol dehydrogenase class IV
VRLELFVDRRESGARDQGRALGARSADRLHDVGVAPEQVDHIVEGSMQDRWIRTNPRQIDCPAAIRTLLNAVW